MCLLIVAFRVVPGYPLVIGANRDEFLARPAVPMTVLRESAPRILGGRDEQAGGTWLAVNERGAFAALTNFPAPARDPAKRSRGELPLALAGHPAAAAAVAAFCSDYRPADYNPAWLLAGDRADLHYLDFTAGDLTLARPLGPGIHVLENGPLEPPSPKAAHVLAALERHAPDRLPDALPDILASHSVPPSGPLPAGRPAALGAACVHAGPYGTRWSALVLVPDEGLPVLRYSDGPPCAASYATAGPLWSA